MSNLNVLKEEDSVEGGNFLEKGMEEKIGICLNLIIFSLTDALPIIPNLWNGN